MEQAQETQQTNARLERPVDGRSVAGVAAGLSSYFNVPVGLVRVGFVIGIFFGGIGLAAYAAGWVLIREQHKEESLLEQWLGNASSPASWIGLGLIAIALVTLVSSFSGLSGTAIFAVALIVLGVLMYRGTFDEGVGALDLSRSPAPASVSGAEPGIDDGGAADPGPDTGDDLTEARQELDEEIPEPDTGGSVPPPKQPAPITHVPARPPKQRSRIGRFTYAALLIVVGSMAVADTTNLVNYSLSDYFAVSLILVGTGLLVSVVYGRAYSLVFVGLLLVLMVQFTNWFDVRLGGGFGDPIFRITTVEELDTEYRLLAGELRLDLSRLDPEGTVQTEVSIGAGELTVQVPDDVNVVVDLRVVAGELNTPSGQVNGTDLDRRYERSPEGAIGTIEIDASIGFGQLNLQLEPRQEP